MFTLTNRNGETVQTPYTPEQLASKFAQLTKGDHWAFFWMAQVVMAAEKVASPMRDMIGFISDLFVIAVGRGLKNPMIRMVFRQHNRRYKLYLSARGTVCLKGGDLLPGTSDPIGDEEYVGCILPDGKFLPNRDRGVTVADKAFLDILAKDPVGFFHQSSKDMDRCCYCGKALEDSRSREAGYGKTCAANWGLPWGESGTQEIPTFASLWAKAPEGDKRSIQGICHAIRQTPTDVVSWMALRDNLSEAGWPDNRLPNMPASPRKMARA
jgi:hypothetical protein